VLLLSLQIVQKNVAILLIELSVRLYSCPQLFTNKFINSLQVRHCNYKNGLLNYVKCRLCNMHHQRKYYFGFDFHGTNQIKFQVCIFLNVKN